MSSSFIFISFLFLRRLGWDAREGEGHLDMMLRGELLVALAELGHDITQNEASRRFSLFLDDRNTSLLPPDTRKVEYIDVNAYMLFDTYKLVDIIFYFV